MIFHFKSIKLDQMRETSQTAGVPSTFLLEARTRGIRICKSFPFFLSISFVIGYLFGCVFFNALRFFFSLYFFKFNSFFSFFFPPFFSFLLIRYLFRCISFS